MKEELKQKMISVIGSYSNPLVESIAESCAQVAIDFYKERDQALSMSVVSGELFCSCGKPSKIPLCFDCFKSNLDKIDPQNNYH
jgi:hypothetical protein